MKFKDFIELHRGYDLPKKYRHKGNIPIVASTGIDGTHNEMRVKGPGVITGRSGSIGKVSYVNKNFWPLNTTLFVSNFKGNNPKYVYYWLQQFNLQKYATGSAVPTLNRNDLSNIDIFVHTKFEQDSIVKLLAPFENKIELANKINDNLETIRTVIFNRLFANKMLNQKNGKIKQIASLSTGKRPKRKHDYSSPNHNIPIVGASKVMGYTSSVLYDNYIITTGRVGTHGIIQRYKEPIWVSDNSFVFMSDHQDYLYEILKNFVDYSSLNRGSTQPLITQTDLKNVDIYIPSESEFDNFENLTKYITESQFNLRIENVKLDNLKRMLLENYFV
ncbi:restriction endonuclease subunit S [Ligilactobacillus acidipiscis]|uniref:restriction endonuclease subunit S n=1 Tax=Ligilactobacillus acidipiscis TaxID=89059 RepID=UPI0022E59531|nr:restriction endonuclease subunit S [Ligilactobacillus acidipiscis]